MTTTPAQPLTTREVATALDTDPKTLRRFLRDPKSTYAAAGQGGRYGFTKRELPGLKKRFTAWTKDQAAARKVRDDATELKRRATDKATEARRATDKPKASGKATAPSAPTFTAEQRVDRLEAMLRGRGTHISQHR